MLFITRISLTALVLLVFSMSARAAPILVIIDEVYVDAPIAGQMTIVGQDFDRRAQDQPPLVTFGQFPGTLNVVSFSANEIVVELPADIVDGDFLLTVRVSPQYLPRRTDYFNVTVGAVGPQGPVGEAGPQGPQGIQGETGPQGLQGATGPQGAQGEPGQDGADGSSCTVSTGAAGVVTVTCDDGTSAVLNDVDLDGIPDGVDECPLNPDGCSTTVFVTDAIMRGNFARNSTDGALAEADAICQAEADAAGLTGTYFAWLSVNATSSPASRFVQSPHRYLLPTGTVVADDWNDLTDGSLQAAISVNAAGTAPAGFCSTKRVWTATNADGSFAGDGTCSQWTANVLGAMTGENDKTDSDWTQTGLAACNVSTTCGSGESDTGARLYCFEQFGQ